MSNTNNRLKTRTQRDVANFLKKVASTPRANNAAGRNRLLFGMDATASRARLWDQAMHIQHEMFTETQSLGGLVIQLAYYQGYGEFYASTWHSRPETLLKDMRTVQCVSGITQIARMLRHAIDETKQRKLEALVFVGDCCEEDEADIEKLAGQLSILGVPAFMFQEGYDVTAERVFRNIARITRGAYCRFDASSAQQLKELLQAVAVYAAGGRQALARYDESRKLISHIHAQLPKR